jgi:hypothetical protein
MKNLAIFVSTWLCPFADAVGRHCAETPVEIRKIQDPRIGIILFLDGDEVKFDQWV